MANVDVDHNLHQKKKKRRRDPDDILVTLSTTPFPCSMLHVYRYDGYDSNTNFHSYSYTTTEWGTAAASTTSSSTFEEGDIPYLIADTDLQDDLSLDVKFIDSASLTTGDTWTILISSCGAANFLPEGASATLSSKDGTAAIHQLTLDRGYEGTVPGSQDVYSVNQHFTVRASGEKEEGFSAFIGSSIAAVSF